MSFRASQLSDQEQMFLRQLSQLCTRQERQIFRAKIIGANQQEIAFILGINQSTVSRALKKITKALHKRAILAPIL